MDGGSWRISSDPPQSYEHVELNVTTGSACLAVGSWLSTVSARGLGYVDGKTRSAKNGCKLHPGKVNARRLGYVDWKTRSVKMVVSFILGKALSAFFQVGLILSLEVLGGCFAPVFDAEKLRRVRPAGIIYSCSGTIHSLLWSTPEAGFVSRSRAQQKFEMFFCCCERVRTDDRQTDGQSEKQ